MKKVLIIIIFLFTLTGCYNYVEINNLVLISGIGIDYDNDEYKITFEVLNQNKENSDSNFEWGKAITVSGNTIANAFSNFEEKISKKAYYAHMKLMILSENVAKNKFKEITEFILRNNEIRNNFYLAISDEYKPEELLNIQDKYYPVASDQIKDIIENKKYRNYITNDSLFKNIVNNYLTSNKNIYLTTLSLEDKKPVIGKTAIFTENKLVNYLDLNETETMSILLNKKPNIFYKYKCEENKYITLEIYKSIVKYNIKKNFYTLDINIDSEVLENNCDKKSKDNDPYKEKIIKDLESNITKLINKLKNNNSDIIGISNKYYIKYKNKNNKYFENTNFKVSINMDINKKGQIIELEK